MGNIFKREIKSSRKELTTDQIEEEKGKEIQISYNHRHSSGDITIGHAPPIQMERSNLMGLIMDNTIISINSQYFNKFDI